MTTTSEAGKMKRSFKMPTVYTILFSIIALVALMTWVLPAGKYDYVINGTQQVIPAAEVLDYNGDERLLPVPGSYHELESSPQGVIDVLMAPIKGFHKAVDVALFVLVIGGFLAVTMRTGAMDSGVAAIVRKFHGREQLMIPVLITLFALGGSTYGMAEETVAFWAVILPVMAVAGYDRMVAAGIILLGSGVGVLASTVNPFATGIASGFAGLPIGDGIVLRVIQLAILIVLASWFVMRYAAKVKADKSNSVLADIEFNDEFSHVSEDTGEFTTKQKWTMGIFFTAFLIMIYGVIPWADMGITAIPTMWWWFDELSTLFLAAAILIAVINRMPEGEFIKTFIEGAKDLIGVALVVAVARGIYVVMDNGVIIDTILNWAEGVVTGLSSGVFVVVTYFVHIVLSFFIPSTSGLATVSMPLMAPLADFSGIGRDLIITAYQSASGWINLFAPTAGHLVAGLALAKIPYERFLKWVMPFVGMVLAVTVVLLFVGAAMV
ncbi:C4-dicarboxylate ABC transporter [Photobacterium aquae]|uniref:C4-dicarboxylate ABC transporter n=1 Tax=Photobacterium aquae TaxID=1195763 RepID=A0A0J1K4E8_9GAMM|nr:YfcC family protein [Photobacterium aquae]KLV09272.1 C4-dicarboxylate ABC transporter [Photobacterium aquae]